MQEIQKKINEAIVHYDTTAIYMKGEGGEKDFLRIPVPVDVEVEDLCDTINSVIQNEGYQIDDENLSKYIDVIPTY